MVVKAKKWFEGQTQKRNAAEVLVCLLPLIVAFL